MTQLFKKLNLIFYVGTIILAVFLALATNFLNISIFIVAIIYLIIWYLFYLIMNRIAQKKVGEIVNKINECEPDCYIKFYHERIANVKSYYAFGNEAIHKYFLQILSLAYLVTCENEKALDALEESTKYYQIKKKNIEDEIFYLSIYFNHYLIIEDIQNAQKFLEQRNNILSGNEISEQQKEYFMQSYLRDEYLLSMYDKDFVSCDKYLKNEFKNAETRLEKVDLSFTLGELYLEQERMTEAIEMFSYVAKNGGTTCYQKEALEYIKHLEAI
jgi:tetratricopeptide (TPR) repeat protein